MAGGTFVKLKTTDLEALGEGIADDDGIAMTAVGAQRRMSAILTLFSSGCVMSGRVREEVG